MAYEDDDDDDEYEWMEDDDDEGDGPTKPSPAGRAPPTQAHHQALDRFGLLPSRGDTRHALPLEEEEEEEVSFGQVYAHYTEWTLVVVH
eukprot:1190819-Prorocentrum_minimum.AAC.3